MTSRHLLPFLFLSAPLLWLAPLGQAQQPVGDDDDDRAERLVRAQRSIQENCLICHSDELITSQRLTAKQWKAEIEKMVGWGSPLPVEARDLVTEYLTATYPDTQPKPTVGSAMLGDVAASIVPKADANAGSVERGGPLYSKNCANCHGAAGEGSDLGPNLVEKPSLYRRDEYMTLVRQGRGRMPGFGSVVDPQADDDILAWLRARRYLPKVGGAR